MSKGRRKGAPAPKPQVKGPIVERNLRAISEWKDRIAEAMKEQRYSQRALSARAGLGVTSLRYLINDAQTISLDTAAMLASALGLDVKEIVTGERVTLDIDPEVGRVRLKVLAIKDADTGSDETHGVVALPSEYVNGHDVAAFKQPDQSMLERGQNEPVPPESIVGEGDVIIWSSSDKPKPGSLIVIADKIGGDTYLCVRRLGRDGDGYVALANNTDFGRRSIELKDVIGSVVSINRAMH